jgi:ubiquinone/menaquinone biosynthesis C-methylase UbiE
MARRLDIKPDSKVLDVGSGTGVFLPFLSSRIGRRGQIIALDVAEEMLKKAQAKYLEGNIYYLHADANRIPLHSEVFDSVVCYSSFPHFQDKPRALGEINRVTKNGGRLLICHTSSRNEINQIHHQIPALANDLIPDRGEMRRILLEAGFSGVRIDDGSNSYLASARKG